MFGLDEKTISLITNVLQHYDCIDHAKLFGSRARETHRHNSDIDIVLFGAVNDDTRGHIKAELDALPTAYMFDVVVYPDINQQQLKTQIDRYGKPLYAKMHP